MAIIGYFVFIFIVVFLSPWLALILMPIILPVSVLLGSVSRKAGYVDPANNPIAGVWGGLVHGFTLFLIALGTRAVFKSDPAWLTGIGFGLIVFTAPKVMNAKYAVPVALASFFLLSLILIPDLT
jgi:hypothetical protein